MPTIQMLPEIQVLLDKWQLVMTPLKESGAPFTKEEELKSFNKKTGEADYKNNRELYTQNAARLLDYFVFHAPDVMKNIVIDKYENSAWGKLKAATALQSHCANYINPAAYYLDHKTCVPFITSEKLYQKMQWMEWVLTKAQNYITNNSKILPLTFKTAANIFISTRLPATTERLNEYAKNNHLARLSVDELEQQFDKEQVAKIKIAVEEVKDDEYVEIKITVADAPVVIPEAAKLDNEALSPSAEYLVSVAASTTTSRLALATEKLKDEYAEIKIAAADAPVANPEAAKLDDEALFPSAEYLASAPASTTMSSPVLAKEKLKDEYTEIKIAAVDSTFANPEVAKLDDEALASPSSEHLTSAPASTSISNPALATEKLEEAGQGTPHDDYNEEITELEAQIEATKKHAEAVRLKVEEIANRKPSNQENTKAGWGSTFLTYLPFKKTDVFNQINQKRHAIMSETHEAYLKKLQELEAKLLLVTSRQKEDLRDNEIEHHDDEVKQEEEKEKSLVLPSTPIAHDEREEVVDHEQLKIIILPLDAPSSVAAPASPVEEKSPALPSTPLARDEHESIVEPGQLEIIISPLDAPSSVAIPASPVEEKSPASPSTPLARDAHELAVETEQLKTIISPLDAPSSVVAAPASPLAQMAPFEIKHMPLESDKESCIRELKDYVEQRQIEAAKTKKKYHSILGSVTGYSALTKETAAINFIKLLEGKKTHFYAEQIAALKTGRLKSIIQKYENKLLLPLEFIDTNNMVMCKERLVQALQNYIIKRHGSSIQKKTPYYHFWSRGLGYAATNKTVSADKMIHLLEGKMQDNNGLPIVLNDEDVGALRQGELNKIIRLYEKHINLPVQFTAAESRRLIHNSAAPRANRPL